MRVAIIPARGGSKRIPGKNIRPFAGKPVIAYSIECALGCGLFERVIVSTDDPQIAAVALAHGAEAPFMRPAGLSGDHAGTAAVISHAIGWLRGHDIRPEAVCCIYATAPFLRKEDLERGWSMLHAGNWEFVFSATDYGYPVLRSFRRSASGGLEMFFPEHFDSRSQDLPEAFHDAGQFYWGRAEAWTDDARIFGERSTFVRIPRSRVQDIDTEEDWIQAERMAALQEGRFRPAG